MSSIWKNLNVSTYKKVNIKSVYNSLYVLQRMSNSGMLALDKKTDNNENNGHASDAEPPSKKLCVDTAEGVTATTGNAAAQRRLKTKKMAMLLSYCGKDYFGMQRNPGAETIEEEILRALHKAKLITDEQFAQIQLISFQRAARTDKGVSALKQTVSLKLPIESKPEDVNAHLPEQVKVFAIKRATKGFNSKDLCDARTYSYMLPTYAFAPGPVREEDELPRDYRITPEILETVSEVLTLFQGTHNYHNFTSGKRFEDPSAKRYIMSFTCGEPFVRDLEFVVLKVKGQSFMLHQIRKMVALTIALIKGFTTVDIFPKAWSSKKLDIPRAPGLGLLLEEVHYDRYNRRVADSGTHEELAWHLFDDVINEFKEKYIYPNIVKGEVEEKSMLEWLQYLNQHTFDVRIEKAAEETIDPDERLLINKVPVDSKEVEDLDDFNMGFLEEQKSILVKDKRKNKEKY